MGLVRSHLMDPQLRRAPALATCDVTPRSFPQVRLRETSGANPTLEQYVSRLLSVTDSQPELGVELAEVTKGMISLHRRFYGKGPTRVKTYAIDDTVVCVLEGGFTTVERTLIDEDDVEAVLQVRRSFQRAMESQFTDVVEDALSRKVVAYMSQ